MKIKNSLLDIYFLFGIFQYLTTTIKTTKL